jgi:exodeoxyribonuclease-3
MSDRFVDAFRATHADVQQFTWWDYRGSSLRLNRGLRIDYLFVSPSLINAIVDVRVDSELRHGDHPSDHAPVVLELKP